MPPVRELSSELRPLAETLRQKLEAFSIPAVDALIAENAPDERLALAGLLQLAELTAEPVGIALCDKHIAPDLVFCLGSSELVRSGLVAAGHEWLDLFRRARLSSPESVRARLRCEPIMERNRQDAAAVLARFKQQQFL